MIENRIRAARSATIGPGKSNVEQSRARWLGIATSALAVVTIVAAILAMRRYAALWNWPQLSGGLRRESISALAKAAALTLVSFVALGAYDVLGCSVVVPGRIRLGTALFAGAAGNAISNTLGFHAVTGTAVRLRIYRRAGIAMGDALRVVSLSWLGIGLGFVTLIALAGLGGTQFGIGSARPAHSTSLLIALTVAAFIFWLSKDGRTVRLGKASLALPSSRTALGLVVVGAIENGAAIAALYVLLPAGSAPPFIAFALTYASAVALGVASQVPGGLGVFEAALMAIWAADVGPGLPLALVVYRLVYNLVPFTLAIVVLGVWEIANSVRDKDCLSSMVDSSGSGIADGSEVARVGEVQSDDVRDDASPTPTRTIGAACRR